MPMVPAMMILVLWGLIRSIGATRGPIFQGIGKPGTVTKLQFAQLILLAILIYPLSVKWGILGTSLAVLLGVVGLVPIASYLTIKIIHCRVWEYVKLIVFPALATLFMCGVLLVFKYFIFNSVEILSFFTLIAIGVIIYAGMAIGFDWLFGYNMRATLQELQGMVYK